MNSNQNQTQLNKTLEDMKDQNIRSFTSFGGWGVNHVKEDKLCKRYGCNDLKQPGYPACSAKHGWDIKTTIEQTKKVQENLDYKWQDRMIGIGNKSVAEIIYYIDYPYVS